MQRAGQGARQSPSSSIPRKRPAETQEEAWVADEDRFVLQQAKKKAIVRARAGRAKPIDLLAVTLRIIDPTRNAFDDDEEDDQSLVINPESVFEDLDAEDLEELEKGIDTYLALEKSKSNHDYWQTMKLVCKDRRQTSNSKGPSARGLSAVAPELDRVLGPKNLQELETLEKQVKHKLRTDDSIDVDYWENLLKRLSVHKARAKLRNVSQDIIGARLSTLRKQQAEDAAILRTQVQQMVTDTSNTHTAITAGNLDPEALLKLPQEDKSLTIVDESAFQAAVLKDRQRVLKAGFVSAKKSAATNAVVSGTAHGAGEQSKSSSAYEREVAKGMDDDEEVFTAEEDIASARKPAWADTYKPRKPRYFNRVQLGYEWNKYNQTHYDQDNPPPKVVQGYKFNIFYPDLVDKAKAPTYRMERENGRKRGQTFAPAGEDDTCIIRFIAGAPYEDVAFRIVDKEWDYSAKHERGFRSSFDKGILQLHFQFKKIYYRK
ncbi:hypothetical protein MBLNU457_3093t3 [Dothideomycetes sp. NU457]